jgi:alpha-tubulin suppressor-like RCC1 family protein
VALIVVRRAFLAALCTTLLVGCSSDPTGTGGGAPAVLELVDGDAQVAAAASMLGAPIRIRVLDARGEPVADVGVTFLADAGSGILSPAAGSTDDDGIAITSWQLPAHVGTMRGQAVVEGLEPVVFTAISNPGAAVTLVIQGERDVASTEGTALDTAMTVRVVDRYGNPITGATVTFRSSTGGGTVGSPTAVSDAQGVARTTWRLSSATGWHTLSAEVPGALAATMSGAVFPAEQQPTISIGGRTACAILEGLFCWGSNGGGQVGDGTTLTRDEPVQVGVGTDWRAIVVGRGTASIGSTCAVNAAAQLYCWGAGLPGGTSVPALVAGAPATRSVAIGTSAACLLSIEDRVLCWGTNALGQLGTGNAVNASTPLPIASTERFRAIAMGNNFACAISVHGRLYCWGSNSSGTVGDGTLILRRLPVAVQPQRRFKKIVAGGTHACAQEFSGAWSCWGLDDWSVVSALPEWLERVSTPRRLDHLTASHTMHLGPSVSCGLSSDGAALCWGDNRRLLLGDIGVTAQPTPVAVAPNLRFSELALGERVACGLTQADQVHCWGENFEGGVGVRDRTFALAPVPVVGAPPFARITTGAGISCGLTSGGVAWCWGLGRPVQPVPGGLQFTTIDAGGEAACGLSIGEGTAWCWGDRRLRALGEGQDEMPTAVAGNRVFTSLSVMGTWACGLDPAGMVWCWGSGRGTPSLQQSTPAPVASTVPLLSMRDTCGLAPTAQGYCWFPSGSSEGARAVHMPGFGSDILDLGAGCGLHADGSLSCGDGNNHPAGTFVRLLDGPCGIAPSGGARCWGFNDNGRLGIGAVEELYREPRPIVGSVLMQEVSIGGSHGCGLDADGRAYCWGTDRELALGNGALYFFPVPQQILPRVPGAQ